MLTSKQVETMLMALHEVAPENQTALGARLKHLKKLDWPRGVRTGHGVPASYSVNAILELAVCFELLQAGLTPERAVEMLEPLWASIRSQAAQVAASPGAPRFLSCDPQALHYYVYRDPLGLHHRTDSVENDPALQTFWAGSAHELGIRLRQRPARRLVVIDLSGLIGEITAWLEQSHGMPGHRVHQIISAWPAEDAAAARELERAFKAGELDDELKRLAVRSPENWEEVARLRDHAAMGVDLSEPGLRTARKICKAWKLNADETAALLSVPDNEDADSPLDHEQITRVSLVTGVFRDLMIAWSVPSAQQWLHRHSADLGARPMSVMQSGLDGLERVRRYLADRASDS